MERETIRVTTLFLIVVASCLYNLGNNRTNYNLSIEWMWNRGNTYQRALLQTCIFIFTEKRLRLPHLIFTWECSSQGLVLAWDRPSSLDSTRDMDLLPSSRDNSSRVRFKTSHPNSTSWTWLFDLQFFMALRSWRKVSYKRIGPKQ